MCYNRQHLLVLAWLASIVTVGGSNADRVLADTAKPSRIDEIVHWLPLDTETIIVASGPLELEKAPDEVERAPDGREFPFQKTMESLPMGIFQDLMPKELVGKKVVLAIEGSRRFRPPRELGMCLFQGCEVVVFQEDAMSALPAAMRSLLATARRTIELSGQQVAVFERTWEKDTWTLYVTQPRPGILLCATHEGYLKETLTRMKEKPGTRAMADDIPEWKHVNTKSRVWGIRHYSKAGSAQDPTSMPTEMAGGVTFSYDPGGKRATVCYVTRAENKYAVAMARDFWGLSWAKLKPKVEEVEAGVVQVTISVDSDKVGGSFFFLLLHQLGHGVSV